MDEQRSTQRADAQAAGAMKRITIRLVRRRTAAELTELARDNLLGHRWVVPLSDERAIRSSFYMMLTLSPPFTDAAARATVALIGSWDDHVPGRYMNGRPIFTSMGFLHRGDWPTFCADTDRMRAALGLPVG